MRNKNFDNYLMNIGRLVFPIMKYEYIKKSPSLIGSGVIQKIGERYYLITAKHVIDSLDSDEIVTSGKTSFIRFNYRQLNCFLPFKDNIDIDLFIIELPNTIINELNTELTINEESDVSEFVEYNDHVFYAFVGYPYSKNEEKDLEIGQVHLKSYFYICRKYEHIEMVRSNNKDEHYHVAFKAPFKKSMNYYSQNKIEPPKPNGISGCGVWKITFGKDGELIKPQLVGIGIEYIRESKSFISTRIASWIKTLKVDINDIDQS